MYGWEIYMYCVAMWDFYSKTSNAIVVSDFPSIIVSPEGSVIRHESLLQESVAEQPQSTPHHHHAARHAVWGSQGNNRLHLYVS